MSHYVYRNLQATEISKLGLRIRRLHLADSRLFIRPMTSYTLFSLRLGYDEKRLA